MLLKKEDAGITRNNNKSAGAQTEFVKNSNRNLQYRSGWLSIGLELLEWLVS